MFQPNRLIFLEGDPRSAEIQTATPEAKLEEIDHRIHRLDEEFSKKSERAVVDLNRLEEQVLAIRDDLSPEDKKKLEEKIKYLSDLIADLREGTDFDIDMPADKLFEGVDQKILDSFITTHEARAYMAKNGVRFEPKGEGVMLMIFPSLKAKGGPNDGQTLAKITIKAEADPALAEKVYLNSEGQLVISGGNSEGRHRDAIIDLEKGTMSNYMYQ